MNSSTPAMPDGRATPATPSADVQRRRRIFLASAAALACAVVAVVAGATSSAGRGEPGAIVTPSITASVPPPATATTAAPSPDIRPQPLVTDSPSLIHTFDRQALSIDDPASIWVIVNKHRSLNPADYVPTDLVEVPVDHTWVPEMRREASEAVVLLFAAASDEAGFRLASNSAYRSYSTQQTVYSNDVAANGQDFADSSTMRPGHSEHQTGLTMDIGSASGRCSLDTCFADTDEGQWLAANAWRFGFVLRYPADKVDVTGIAFEPWHYRYVGVALSTEMRERGVTTLEEFFELESAPGYL